LIVIKKNAYSSEKTILVHIVVGLLVV